jgi:hypothetical protein
MTPHSSREGRTTHDRLVLVQSLIVFRNGNDEDETRHTLKTMDPFLPLRSLPTGVEPREEEGEDEDSEGRRVEFKVSNNL